MTTLDSLQAEVSAVRLRLKGPEELTQEELETLLTRLEVIRLQMEQVHREAETALTLQREDLEDLETEDALRRLGE